MTWDAITTTGRGELAFRLEIEGWPESWVTHSSMISLSTTPFRYGGLRVTGQKLKAIANPLTNELDVSGFSASVVDDQERATASFARRESNRTWLTAELTGSATTATVRSTDGFPLSGTLWLNSEAIAYTGKTATTFTGLTRGSLGTLAQKHPVASVTGVPRYPEITDRPINMTGRRARLYAYGQLDDPQGSGTQVWLGVVTRHPSMQGGAWKIPIDPITRVLERTVSGDLADPTAPRGIRYSATSRFSMAFMRRDTSGVLRVEFPRDSADRGFFNNNADFCDYLTDQITTLVEAQWAGNEIQIGAVPLGEDSWYLTVSSDGTVIEIYEQPPDIDPQFPWLPLNDDGVPVGTEDRGWVADAVYKFLPLRSSRPGAGGCPRGYYGSAVPISFPEAAVVADPNRIYLASGADLSSVEAVAIKVGDTWRFPALTEINPSSNYIETEPLTTDGFGISTGILLSWTPADLPEIRFGRTFTTSGSAWTALSAIIAGAPNGINSGAFPDLRAGDFDATAWAELDDVGQPRIVRSRKYVSFGSASLMDLVRAELTLAGYFLGINGSGEITIARLRPLAATTGGVAPVVVTSSSAPTYEPDAYGQASVLYLRRGYDPIEDEWTLPTVKVWDVTALGRNPTPRVLTIEPRSVLAGDLAESYEEAVTTTARLFAVFARPYARIQLDTSLHDYASTVTGSVVRVSTDLLPDAETGTRGVSSLPCLVTGREVDLSAGRVSLKLLHTASGVVGYAPQSLISAESNISGNTWDVTLTASGYFPAGTDASDWFVAGDEVIAAEWDSTSTTTIAGVVVPGGSGNTVRVTFNTSAAAIASGDWFLSYAPADTFVQSSQERFAFLADSDGRIDFSTAVPARRFG